MKVCARRSIGALLLAVAATITPACASAETKPQDPLLVLETPGSKFEALDLIVVDLAGRELLRQSTDAAEGSALTSLHAATAQVAFWRTASAGHQLVVWNIATRALKVVATSANPPAVGPLWSIDGTEIVSLTTSSPISWAPGAPFEGKADVSVATVATGQLRTLATDHLFVPSFANGTIVAGESFSGEKKYVVVDARSGRTLQELALNTVGVLATANPDVVMVMRETATPGDVTVHAVNTRTGTELSLLGQGYAQPMPSWPGRNEIVFVENGDLKAFEYFTNSTRVVGRLEGATYALGFDPLGMVLLTAQLPDVTYGTFTVANGRLTSSMRRIPSPSLGRPLGLIRVNL